MRPGCHGFISHIHRRRPPGRPLPAHVRRGNARCSRDRAPVKHVFAVQKQAMGCQGGVTMAGPSPLARASASLSDWIRSSPKVLMVSPSGALDRRDDPGRCAPLCRVQVRSGGLRIGEKRVDRDALPAVEEDHPRAASLAPARRIETQFPDVAGSRNLPARQNSCSLRPGRSGCLVIVQPQDMKREASSRPCGSPRGQTPPPTRRTLWGRGRCF